MLHAVSNVTRAVLLSGATIAGLVPPSSAADGKAETYLAVWASDKETDDHHLDPDFWQSSTQIRDRRLMARS